MRISIIGSGVVGTATGKGLSKLGHLVVFNDVNGNRLKELFAEGHEVTHSVSDAVMSTSISFVCVQTPTVKGKIDLRFIRNAIISVARTLEKKRDYHLVVVRSTILPGTTRKVILPLLRRYCSSQLFEDYGVCYNPEFLRQATALEDFLNPSRVVIGVADKKSGDILEELYSPLTDSIIKTDFETAEMIKYVSNAFLATKISFFNEMYMLCRKLGIDDKFVSQAVSLDPRIGKYGVYGGRSFSGGCLPKDLEAFASFIKDLSTNPDIIESVLAINSEVKKNTKCQS